jgi:hypothetical protein
MVMIVPINPEKNKTQDIAEKERPEREQRGEACGIGTFSSSTIMVMMIAKTPSLKASSRFLSMRKLGLTTP